MRRGEQLAWVFSWTGMPNVLCLVLPTSNRGHSTRWITLKVSSIVWLQHHIASSLLPLSPRLTIFLTSQQLGSRQTMLSSSSAVWVSRSFDFLDCYWLHSRESTDTALTEKLSVWAAIIVVAVGFPQVQKPMCITVIVGLLQYMKNKHFTVLSADDFFVL